MFVANASDQEVFFDQMVVEYIPQLIVQENHYYPFGLELSGIMKKGKPEHKFKYNGVENEQTFGLNWSETTQRQYSSQLGRFMATDPLTERAYHLTPYRFGFNNPVSFDDPSGLWEKDKNGNWSTTDSREIYQFLNLLSTFKGDVEISENQVSEGNAFKLIGFDKSDRFTSHNVIQYGGKAGYFGANQQIKAKGKGKKVENITSGVSKDLSHAAKYVRLLGFGIQYSSLLSTKLSSALSGGPLNLRHVNTQGTTTWYRNPNNVKNYTKYFGQGLVFTAAGLDLLGASREHGLVSKASGDAILRGFVGTKNPYVAAVAVGETLMRDVGGKITPAAKEVVYLPKTLEDGGRVLLGPFGFLYNNRNSIEKAWDSLLKLF